MSAEHLAWLTEVFDFDTHRVHDDVWALRGAFGSSHSRWLFRWSQERPPGVGDAIAVLAARWAGRA